jgi:hypothetical protein
MSRREWLNGVGATILLLSTLPASLFASDSVHVASSASTTVTSPAKVPVQQVNWPNGYCHPRLNVWNGIWGPGVYYAPRGIRWHGIRHHRPD